MAKRPTVQPRDQVGFSFPPKGRAKTHWPAQSEREGAGLGAKKGRGGVRKGVTREGSEVDCGNSPGRSEDGRGGEEQGVSSRQIDRRVPGPRAGNAYSGSAPMVAVNVFHRQIQDLQGRHAGFVDLGKKPAKMKQFRSFPAKAATNIKRVDPRVALERPAQKGGAVPSPAGQNTSRSLDHADTLPNWPLLEKRKPRVPCVSAPEGKMK